DGATVQWHASLVEVGSLSGHFSRLRIEGVGTTSRGGSFGIGSGAQMEVRGGADLQSPVGGVVTRALGRYQMENAIGMLEIFDVIGGDAFITHGSVLTVAQVVMEGGLLQITDPASKLLGVDNFRIDSGTLDVLAGAVLSVDSFLMSAGRVLRERLRIEDHFVANPPP
ncbi:MAG: hypothetical protein IPK15_26535, partial [Verrucomicrobia bacterium]|nr:hypothetical protein [Verrucomicrobiota bacterium]